MYSVSILLFYINPFKLGCDFFWFILWCLYVETIHVRLCYKVEWTHLFGKVQDLSLSDIYPCYYYVERNRPAQNFLHDPHPDALTTAVHWIGVGNWFGIINGP